VLQESQSDWFLLRKFKRIRKTCGLRDPVNHLILSFVILIASDRSAALYRTVP
jgi:hypothetical protein